MRLVYAMPRRCRGEREKQLQTLSLGLHVILDGILYYVALIAIIVFLLSHGSHQHRITWLSGDGRKRQAISHELKVT